MATLKYERLAIVALDALLAGGLEIVQHYYDCCVVNLLYAILQARKQRQ